MLRAKHTILLCPLLMLAACASSRHTTATTNEELRQTATEMHDTTHVQTMTADSTARITQTEAATFTHTEDTDTTRETIVEHIVETYDSAGLRHVTTDRTTTRKAGRSRQTTAQDYQRQQEVEIAMMLSAFDSIAESRGLTTATHRTKHDSIADDRQTGSAARRTYTVWDVLRGLLVLVGVVGMYMAVFLLYRKMKG